jgi:hypothetical protein
MCKIPKETLATLHFSWRTARPAKVRASVFVLCWCNVSIQRTHTQEKADWTEMRRKIIALFETTHVVLLPRMSGQQQCIVFCPCLCCVVWVTQVLLGRIWLYRKWRRRRLLLKRGGWGCYLESTRLRKQPFISTLYTPIHQPKTKYSAKMRPLMF